MKTQTRKALAVVTAFGFAFAISGCAAVRNDPVNCRLLTGLVGGTVGGVATSVGTHEIDPGSGDRGIAIGAAIGWVVGGIIGLGVGYAICPKDAPAEPPPPPAEPAAAAPAPQRKLILRGVNFDFDSATIRPDAGTILDDAARALREDASVAITIEGHTDAVGTDAYNQKLSERRARAVADALIHRDVASSRITVSGQGESKPVASNDTAEGRAQNRRVEIHARQ
ncbi:MAG: OmpA family protein [Candidatus Binatia bacterium]